MFETAAANVVAFKAGPPIMQGHNNPPSFDDEIAGVLRAGSLVVAWDRVKVAVHDPRLHRKHLRVMVELLDCMNAATGTAWPSREAIGERCGLAAKVVGNALYELRNLGYIAWERRPINTGRRLLQYTVPVTTVDATSLRDRLEQHLATLRERSDTALDSLDRAIAIAKGAPPAVQFGTPPAVHENCTTDGANRKTAPRAVERSTPPVVEQSTPPVVAQELTKELTKEPVQFFEETFDRFWSVYPRKEAKGRARSTLAAILKKAPRGQRSELAENIVAAVKRFAERRRAEDPRFTPLPASWLNAERWEDEPHEVRGNRDRTLDGLALLARRRGDNH